jgi:hypothetical protein
LPSRSIKIGTLKPKVLMLWAICRICFLLWRRGLLGSGFSCSTPIVFRAVAYDPLAKGYIASLAHPGGNLTRVVFGQPELIAKRLDLLTLFGALPCARSSAASRWRDERVKRRPPEHMRSGAPSPIAKFANRSR